MEVLPDINQHLYLKDSLKSSWKPSSEGEVLSNLLETTFPFDKETKQLIPLFGFDKLEGKRDNVQQFPTNFVILELDTPGNWKKQITEGCEKTRWVVQGQTWLWYWQFHYDESLPYYWIYLTPSTCGLRFVLKTNQPVINEAHYIQVVKAFLRLLYRRTNGRINPDYFDIRVNQAWFVPTFAEFFSRREAVFPIQPYQEDPPRKSVPRLAIPAKRSVPPTTADEQFQLAIRFTERKFSYLHGQRNKYIHNLACNCNRFGLAESYTLQWILARYDLEERETISAVRSAYQHNTSEHGSFLKS